DILNYDQVVKVTGSFKTPMGCRSFLGVWENENGEQIHDGRNKLVFFLVVLLVIIFILPGSHVITLFGDFICGILPFR
ncbi:hypothetical protein J4X55_11380, partial [Escherichia coli]